MKFNIRLAKKLLLSNKEVSILKKINTPQKIQDFLGGMPGNLEKKSETLMSPRLVLQKNTCHCVEGALLAGLALWLHGFEPLIVDMKAKRYDTDHVVTVFKQNGYWGAISKTNHAVLRFRDPVYKNLRELMMSYFHEFYLYKTGEKTLLSYSKPFNLKNLSDTAWATSPDNLWFMEKILNKLPHYNFSLNKNIKLRKADEFERKTTKTPENN